MMMKSIMLKPGTDSRFLLLSTQKLFFTLILIILFIGVVLATQQGAVLIAAEDWLAPFAGQKSEALWGSAYVLWQIRLPRVVFALLVGATLGLTGALTQGLFRNPLADPGLLGVSSGAACAVAFTIVLLPTLSMDLPFGVRHWLLPLVAFLGALFTCFTLERVAKWLTASAIIGLLLTGIALNALAAALIGLCTYLASDEQLRNLTFWTLGSLAGGSWLSVSLLSALLFMFGILGYRLASPLNALALGEASAQQLGVSTYRLRISVMLVVAILHGAVTAWCGMIGFIGLVAPHLVRLVVGADQRQVIPFAMLVGALLILLADTLARTAAIPAEMPIGIFTALLGAPFFLMLLLSLRRRGL